MPQIRAEMSLRDSSTLEAPWPLRHRAIFDGGGDLPTLSWKESIDDQVIQVGDTLEGPALEGG